MRRRHCRAVICGWGRSFGKLEGFGLKRSCGALNAGPRRAVSEGKKLDCIDESTSIKMYGGFRYNDTVFNPITEWAL